MNFRHFLFCIRDIQGTRLSQCKTKELWYPALLKFLKAVISSVFWNTYFFQCFLSSIGTFNCSNKLQSFSDYCKVEKWSLHPSAYVTQSNIVALFRLQSTAPIRFRLKTQKLVFPLINYLSMRFLIVFVRPRVPFSLENTNALACRPNASDENCYQNRNFSKTMAMNLP